MQVTETLSDGLKRQYKVSIPATELANKLAGELETLKGRVNINGFRPGKVPVAHLKRVYGRSVMADVLQNTVNETNRKIIEDNAFKLAGEPQITLSEDKEEVEKVMDATGDLEFTVAMELLPKIALADHSDIALTREVVTVEDSEVDAALQRMSAGNRPYADKGAKAKAADGDRVVIDFLGKLDGEPFDGGKGEDMPLVLGSGQFIPGFEEQLVGVKAGDEKVINVTFPEQYQAENLAGKEATFDIKVKGVEAPGDVTIDDEFAKQFGMESLDKLKDAIRTSIGGEFAGIARTKIKRQLLDALDTKYSFDLPPTLLQQEFDAIWKQAQAEMEENGKSFADEGTTEEESKAEYEKIAARRVRLGLVLAEVGEQAKVQVTDDEVSKALVERARQYPGQEKAVWDFYRKNPEALAEIRAPLFEEKVVDHIVGQANVTEKTVTKDELFAADGDNGAKIEGDAPAKKPAKKTKAKKAEEKAAGEE